MDKQNKIRSVYKILVWNPESRRQNRNPEVNWRIILKCILLIQRGGGCTVLNCLSKSTEGNGFTETVLKIRVLT